MSDPERAKRLYLGNPTASIGDVARLMDKSPSTIRNWLVAEQAPMRSWADLCRNRRNKHKDYVIMRHVSAPPEEIAQETGLSVKQVIYILQDNHCRRSRSEARNLYFEKLYTQKRKTALHMLKTMSGMEVARRLGLHSNTIYRWRQRYT